MNRIKRLLPDGFRSPNLLPNSRWGGGGTAPTGWSSLFGTGTSAPNGEIAGDTIYRFTAVANRPALFKSGGVPLGASSSLTLTVYVNAVYSGFDTLVNMLSWSSMPAGAATWYSINGYPADVFAFVAAGMRLGVTITSGATAGSPIPRVGPGCNASATVDIDILRPQVNAGTKPSVYNPT